MLQPSVHTPSHRLIVVDALRGFALLGIILLHYIEKFDLSYAPEGLPQWIQTSDLYIREILFFIFAGKSYAILALLFGFSFFIQLNREAQKGNDFSARFLWRLFILLCIGFLHSLIYRADILTLYALMGALLLVISKWKNNVLLILALFLVLQPLEIGKSIYLFFHPDYVALKPPPVLYPLSREVYLKSSSFWEVLKGNFHNCRLSAIFWSFEKGLDKEIGRYFQVPALFIIGMLLGRLGMFNPSEKSISFWKKILMLSIVILTLLYLLKNNIPGFFENEKLVAHTSFIVSTWITFVAVLLLVSLLMLAFQYNLLQGLFSSLAPVGRMSLTNYLILGIVGAFLYYGYGLALYRYMAVTYSFILGATAFFLQLKLSHWWLKTHKQGPVEALWHKLTWIGRK